MICGTAAGSESAERHAYYAGKGNKFWAILHETELTPTQLRPHEFERLREFGIGLTDVAKAASGMDREVAGSAFDVEELREKIIGAMPAAIAFNGKRATRITLGLSEGQGSTTDQRPPRSPA